MRAARTWALITVALLLTALVGCSSINEGRITAKVYEPANTFITTSCTTIGKVTTCTPMTHHDDEDWRFDLIQVTDGMNGNEPKTGWVYVTRETFDAYEVGDYWEASE